MPAPATLDATLAGYVAIPVLVVLAIGVVLGALVTVRLITRWLNHIPVSALKASTYECGEEPIGSAWFRLNPRFVTIALLFVIFDVELALLGPVLPRVLTWIGAGEGGPAALKIGVFVGTLFLALAYAWKRGDLDWDRLIRPVVRSSGRPVVPGSDDAGDAP